MLPAKKLCHLFFDGDLEHIPSTSPNQGIKEPFSL